MSAEMRCVCLRRRLRYGHRIRYWCCAYGFVLYLAHTPRVEKVMELNHHNSKQVWNGKNWVRVALCQNAHRNTDVNYGRGIGVVQCYDNTQEVIATVTYNNSEQSVFKLCKDCLAQLKKSARRNGYTIKSQKLCKYHRDLMKWRNCSTRQSRY